MIKRRGIAYFIFLLIGLCSISIPAFAQFVNVYGTTAHDYGRGMAIMNDGSLYMVGMTGSSATNKDVTLTKLSESGQIIWSKTYGGSGDEEARNIIVSKDNKLVFIGYTSSSGNGNSDGWIVKLDTSGGVIWSRTCGGGSQDGYIKLFQTSDSSYLIGGYTASYGAGNLDAWFIKLTKDGHKCWTFTKGGSTVDYGVFANETDGGNYLFTFYCNALSGGYGQYDWNLLKIDTAGNTLSVHKYGSSGNEGVRSFIKSTDKNFILCGETSYQTWGKGMAIKVDSSGNQLVRKIYQASTNVHVDILRAVSTPDSGCLLAGYIGTDALLLKVDKNLDIMWSKKFVASGNQQSWSIVRKPNGMLLWVGQTTQTNGFGNTDIFLIMTDSLGVFDCRTADAGISLHSPSSNVFNWSTHSLSNSSTSGATGNYSFSPGSHSPGIKNFNLDTDSLPINLSGSSSSLFICQGDSIYLNATSKATKWTWSTGQTTPGIYLDTTKQVRVRIERNYCYNGDTVDVVLRDTLELFMNRDTALCFGQIASFAVSGAGGNPAKRYFTWYDSSSNVLLDTGISYADTFYQDITLKVSLWDSCSSIRDSGYLRIEVNPEISLHIPSDTTICKGELVQFYAYGMNGIIDNYEFNWRNGLSTSDTLNVSFDTTTEIMVTLTDGCSQSPDSGKFKVTVRLPITADLNSDTTICKGQSVSLRASANGGDSTYSYTWNQNLGAGAQHIDTPDVSSTYQVIISDGCTALSDTATRTVTVRPELSLTPRSDTTVCQGESFPLYALGSGGYTPSYRFTWSHGLDTGRNFEVSLDTSSQLRVILSDGCTVENDTAIVSITVRGFLSVSLPDDTTLCMGQSLQLQATGGGGLSSAYTFNWDQGLGSGNSKSISPTTQTTYKVVLSDNCSVVNDSAEITVTVRPAIELTVRSDSTICRGQGIYLYSAATGGDTTYTYSWNHGLPGVQNPYVTPSHTTVYRLIVEDNCSVKSDTAFVTITVRDSLSVTLATDTTICVGESMLLRAESFGGLSSGHQLTWNQGLSGNYTHLVQPASTTSYQVILKDNCTLDSDTAQVTVTLRAPLVLTPRSDTTLCIGQSVLLSASGTGGTPSTHIFTWNKGLGNGLSHTVSPDTTTVYQVILRDNCTTSPDTGEVRVTVRPRLDVTERNDTTICIGESVLLYAQSAGGYAVQHELSWNQSVGTGNYLSVSPATSTRYRVILRDYCTTKPDTGFVDVLVRNPLTVLPRSDTTICIGQNVHLYTIGLGGDSSRYVFDWDNGLDTGRSQIIAPDTTTTYRVVLSDACTEDEDTSEVTIFVRPPLTIIERSDTFICVGEQVRLYANGNGGYTPDYTYTWDGGLDTGNQNLVNPPVTQTYRVILKDNCTTLSDTGYVTVFVRMPLTLVRRSDTTICVGEEVELYFDGTGGDSLHYTFIWNHDAGTGNHRIVTPDTTTTFHVQLTDNCTLESGRDSVMITVREPLSITARSDSTICVGEGIYLYSQYSGGHSPGHELEWDQGLGVTGIPHIFPDTTTEYIVVFRDYCTVASDTDTVRIVVRPPLEISPRTDTLICVGEIVSLFATASGGYLPNHVFEWNAGLDTGQGNVVSPPTTSTYQVIIKDACTVYPDTGYVIVSVRDPLVINPRNDTTLCIGESVRLFAGSTGGDSTYFYHWDQGADLIDTPTVAPAITTTYEVIVRDNCTIKPDTAYVTVFVRPALDVVARLDTLMCRGESVLVSAVASGGDSLRYEFDWDNGIGITPSTMVTPDSTKTYRVIVRDYCTTKSDTDFVTIFTRDALSIQPRSDTTICIGQSVQVYGIPAGGNSAAYTYSWNNGLADQEKHQVSPQTTTIYQVILNDNCTSINDTASFEIAVRAPLDLTIRTDTFICQGETVILYVSATGGDISKYTYTWNQGIGSRVNPLVGPTQNTDYFVTLTDNCTTLSDTGSVNISLPLPLQVSKSNDTLICRNDPVILQVSGSGGLPNQYAFTWDKLGAGITKTVRPTLTTWYAFELDDQCAIPVNDSVLVDVQVPLVPGFIVDPEWACLPNDIEFDDTTTTGMSDVWYNWEFGDGDSDTGVNLLNVNHSFGAVGAYPVRLIVRTALGCYDTSYTVNYQVYPDPVASFDHEYDDLSGTDMTIHFINTTKGGQDYYWDFGDMTTDEFIQDPIHAYAEPKPYTILLIAVNQWGCVDSTFETIDVKDVFRVFIPSAFTPGGSDTLNGLFGPLGTGIGHYDMQIFNRWGQLVYSTDASEEWDGRIDGMAVDIGVYTYVIRVFSTRDVKKSFTGIIHIIR